MKSFKQHIQEAATDDRKEVAKKLKQFAKKYVSGGPISVTSGKGKAPWVELRAKGDGEISNELRKMVIDKVMPKANPTNMKDIIYGNVTKRYIAISADEWKKVMGLNESVEHLDEVKKPLGDFDFPPSPQTKKLIEGGRAKILKKVPSVLGGNSKFVVIERPKSEMGIGNDDKVLMATISDPSKGRIKMFAFHGSHVSIAKAMQFAINNKLVTTTKMESVEYLDEALTLASDNLNLVKKTAEKLAKQSPDLTYYVVKHNERYMKGMKYAYYEVYQSVDMHLVRGKAKKVAGYGAKVDMRESVELDEDYKEMMKWYETSDEKKVYDILKKNKFNLPADSFTLVQNTLKKSKNVNNAARMIMNRYPQFKTESVELDEGSKAKFREILSKGKKLGDWMGKSFFEYEGNLWMLYNGDATGQGPIDKAKKNLNKGLLKAIGLQ